MKRKIIFYFMIISLFTLSLVMVGFGIGIRQYYYQGIVNTFQSQAEAVPSVFTNQNDFTNSNLMEFSDEIIKNYQFEGAELQLLKRSGKVIQSTTGFYEDKTYLVDPSVLDLKTTYKIEKSSYSGQKIMAVYTPFVFDGQVLGILRYTTSLTQVDALIINLLSYGMIICTFIAVIVFLISLRLGNMIVEPLNNIIDFTKKIAEGKYKEKIKNTYPNEFGEIARTLNYMGDEILKTDRLKNDFISSISHELRTPLTGIKGWVETMQDPDGLTDEEFQFGLGIIDTESERLINLVENLLDFSRYQSDRMKLITSEVKVDKLIREVTFQLQKKAEIKEIELIVETTPVIITADGDKLKQVILNVLDNAIKFSYKNSEVHVIQLVDDDSVSIKISDTGIGIKKENLKHVMESFYKIDPKSIGAGLGLVISRNIVDMHNGVFKIDSEYGKGTTVIISLPLERY
ncbi:sensor histidine kinase [Clostridium chromiireducens]|uniref:histidine kinase n=1 Tax=Clostridium chromiireducens TaxID=225345 RepID=A0A1V4ILQ7_9CLOT|nr:HAMP domain-containing sensor histidine kinase [Clostridium chromiireducens]OPJ60833.1 alkaline phosphatase synthesis sensor protein PhoR [Clostridium chromiireducens]RII33210.1 sensor histidine kinase [Clostridium chromiireducens]